MDVTTVDDGTDGTSADVATTGAIARGAAAEGGGIAAAEDGSNADVVNAEEVTTTPSVTAGRTIPGPVKTTERGSKRAAEALEGMGRG